MLHAQCITDILNNNTVKLLTDEISDLMYAGVAPSDDSVLVAEKMEGNVLSRNTGLMDVVNKHIPNVHKCVGAEAITLNNSICLTDMIKSIVHAKQRLDNNIQLKAFTQIMDMRHNG